MELDRKADEVVKYTSIYGEETTHQQRKGAQSKGNPSKEAHENHHKQLITNNITNQINQALSYSSPSEKQLF